MFRITGGKGFHITFENGFTVSVQFGPGNYCEHHNDDLVESMGGPQPGIFTSSDAEVAVWGPDRKMIAMPGWDDTVGGQQSPRDVLELLTWAASQ